MKLILIIKGKLRTFYLPSIVKNNYWITYFDDNGLEQNLINVESNENSWNLISNNDTYCVRGDEMVPVVKLVENQIYFLKTYFQDDNLVLLSLPNIETSLASYDITDYNKKEITIGKLPECTINYNVKLIDNVNTVIIKQNDKYILKDNHSKYGTYLNNIKVTDEVVLEYGDVIFLLGLKLIFLKDQGRDILLLNSSQLNAKVNLPTFVIPKKELDFIDEEDEPIHIKREFYHKNPRFTSSIKPYKVKIDAPPTKENNQNTPLILTIVSMITMSMTSLVSGIFTFNNLIYNKQSITSSLPSLILCFSMFISTVFLPIISRKIEKNYKKKREKIRQEKYKSYIKGISDSINKEIQAQTHIYRNLYPSSLECQNIILNKQSNLWSKRVEDEDFLTVSLGYGNIPMQIDIQYPEKHFSLEEDNLTNIVDELGKEKKILSNVPIKFSLIENSISCIVEKKKNYYGFLKNLIVQLMAFHSYDELKIVVLTDKNNEVFWESIKTSPYLWDDNKKFRFYATNIEEYNEINYILNEELDDNIELKSKNHEIKFDRNYLVISDSFYSVRGLEFVKRILESSSYSGFSLMILGENITSIPPECQTFISLGNKNEVFNKDYSNTVIEFLMDDYSKINLKKCSKVLSNIFIDIQNKTFSNLPVQISLLELYKVGKVEQLNVSSRWLKNNLIFNMQVPVGIDENNEIIYLDLHEKYHGPHGLIAGMTGSGKSEFLITYILSLAINYSPENVQFAIIDYKGGGLSGAFHSTLYNKDLPHLVGTVTNLDDNDINRILLSINSELKRRQEAFNYARDISNSSTIDIYKYQQLYNEKIIDKPVSHLFIIVDEFAEMKKQQPEFMEQLISIARIGRSLGVHLILSTQKPSGVVDNQIWSNSRFRICFRVQDTSDSMEVIKTPDAASLKNVGRFYLQVGYNEVYKLGQSAYSGGIYIPSDNLIKKSDTSVDFIDSVGNVIKKVDSSKNNFISDKKQVESKAILDYIVKTGLDDSKITSPLWLDKLPSVIYLQDLLEKYNYKLSPYELLVGELDSPATQERKLFTLSLEECENIVIYGQGKETENLLRTAVYSNIISYNASVTNYYIIDFGSENFKSFSLSPNVGDVLLIDDSEKLQNLFKFIIKEIDNRKQLLASITGGFSAYYSQTGKSMPLIVIVINNFSSFKDSYNDFIDMLVSATREGSRYGIVFIISCDSQMGFGYKLEHNFKTKLALRLNDRNSYSSIVGRTSVYPSDYFGRGIVNLGTVYEFQTASITDVSNVSDYIFQTCQTLKKNATILAPKIRILPKDVTITSLRSYIQGLAGIPIGISKDTLEPKLFNFKKNYCNLVLADNFDYLIPFTKGLIEILLNIPNNQVITLDAIDALKLQNNICYKENFERVLIDFTSKLEEMHSALIGENNTTNTLTFVLFGTYTIFQKLSTRSIITNFLNACKECENVTVILVDKQIDFKKMEYDDWYKNTIDGRTGIWIGENISNQYTLKTNQSIRESQYKIDDNFGFVVENGKYQLIKIVKG